MKNGVKKETIVRTLVLVFALVNQALIVFGKSPLPYTEETIGKGAYTAIAVGTSLWNWWKNNSFTKAAIEADKVLEDLKTENKQKTEKEE